MTNVALETLLTTMRETLEKLERAIQLPSRKDFETMDEKVDDLARRIAAIEKSGKKKPRKK